MFLLKFADSKVGGGLFDIGCESPYLMFNSSMVASQCKLEMLVFYAYVYNSYTVLHSSKHGLPKIFFLKGKLWIDVTTLSWLPSYIPILILGLLVQFSSVKWTLLTHQKKSQKDSAKFGHVLLERTKSKHWSQGVFLTKNPRCFTLYIYIRFINHINSSLSINWGTAVEFHPPPCHRGDDHTRFHQRKWCWASAWWPAPFFGKG